jgi:hypothetical protein
LKRTLLGAVVVVLSAVSVSQPGRLPASDDFNFSLTGDRALSVTQGRSISDTVTAILSSGAAEPVEFAASDLPPGSTYLFSTAICSPKCASVLTIRTTVATPPGRYEVTVTAMGAGRTRFAPLTLDVTAAPSPVAGLFTTYNRVLTTASTELRASPSPAAPTTGTQSAGAVGTIVEGPIGVDGAIWWHVTYDNGLTGWSLQEGLAKESTATGLRGDCSSEPGLTGRTDIIFCEPWEDPAWWQNGYVAEGEKTRPRPATPGRVAHTRLVSTGCISGTCLEVDMRKGEAGALAVHWPLAAAGQHPEELFVRYYLKLSIPFDPHVCAPDGSIVDSGGKFPGPADVRTDADPGGQCGNGGNPSDGLHCWSLRSKFRDCYGGSAGSACATRGATTRFGHYAYFVGSRDFWGVSGYWDSNSYDQSTGDGGTCRTVASNMYCGLGNGGLLAGRWYRIEMHVKMNTPGRADGILEGWLDGQTVFVKTNMIYRLPGHDDLHVRTMWLNVHTGGDVPNGNCRDQKIWLDQMVLATGRPAGAWTR